MAAAVSKNRGGFTFYERIHIMIEGKRAFYLQLSRYYDKVVKVYILWKTEVIYGVSRTEKGHSGSEGARPGGEKFA